MRRDPDALSDGNIQKDAPLLLGQSMSHVLVLLFSERNLNELNVKKQNKAKLLRKTEKP